jgi:hypothetical protein
MAVGKRLAHSSRKSKSNHRERSFQVLSNANFCGDGTVLPYTIAICEYWEVEMWPL